MKYIKAYEQEQNLPKVGDYVILSSDSSLDMIVRDHGNYRDGYSEHQEFLKNNIGKVVKRVSGTKIRSLKDHLEYLEYPLKYENFPNIMDHYFNNYGYRYIYKQDILFFSSDRADCEAYLSAKKYNL